MGLVLHYDAVWDCGDLGTVDLVVERRRDHLKSNAFSLAHKLSAFSTSFGGAQER